MCQDVVLLSGQAQQSWQAKAGLPSSRADSTDVCVLPEAGELFLQCRGGVSVTWGRSAIEQALAIIIHASPRSDARCCSAALTHPPLKGPRLIHPGGK